MQQSDCGASNSQDVDENNKAISQHLVEAEVCDSNRNKPVKSLMGKSGKETKWTGPKPQSYLMVKKTMVHAFKRAQMLDSELKSAIIHMLEQLKDTMFK